MLGCLAEFFVCLFTVFAMKSLPETVKVVSATEELEEAEEESIGKHNYDFHLKTIYY